MGAPIIPPGAGCFQVFLDENDENFVLSSPAAAARLRLGILLVFAGLGLGSLNLMPSGGLPAPQRAGQAAASESADHCLAEQPSDLWSYIETIRGGAEFDLEAATQRVYRGTSHSDQRRIGLGENWLQWLLGHLYPPLARVQDAQRLVQGGIADCSERAQILKVIAEAAGCECRFIGLSGHVVLDVYRGDQWCVADPDYGVVFPVALPVLESAEGRLLIQERLSHVGHSASVIDWYGQIVQSQNDNLVLPVGSPLSPRLYAVEVNCKWLVWAIPAACLILGLLGLSQLRPWGRSQNSRRWASPVRPSCG